MSAWRNDRDLRLRGVLAGGTDGPALRPLLRIGEARLVARIAQHRRAEPDRDARLVHHVEHAAQALAGLADEVAHGTGAGAVQTPAGAHRVLALAEVQQRVRDAAVTELVVQAGERDVVALAGEPAFGVDQLLRHDEERDAPRAGNELAVGAGNLREHEVDDVLGELVIAVRDPHLVAAQPIARAERLGLEVAAVGHGTGRDVRQARTGLRLGQAHRSREASVELVPCEHRLLQLGAVHHQQVRVAAGQHPATADADAALREERIGGHFDHAGQLHAADVVVLRRGEHARPGIGARGGVAGLRQADRLAVEPGFLGVGEAVERDELLGRQLLAHVEHRLEGLARMVGEARPLGERLDREPVVKQKVECAAHGGPQDRFPVLNAPASHGRDARRATQQGVPSMSCCQSTSNTPAAPMPPPMHIVTTTRLALRRLPSISAWPVRRWPLTP